MARVTVEDCVEKVPNRFELVLLAAQRARDIHSGAALTVERDNDKNAVVALREIADETVELDTLRYELEHGRDLEMDVDEPEEEEAMAILSAEQAWADVTGRREEPEPAEAEAEAADGDVVLDENVEEDEARLEGGVQEPSAEDEETT